MIYRDFTGALLALSLVLPVFVKATDSSPPGVPPPIRSARQCLLVTAADWSSTTGSLVLLEKTKAGAPWRVHGGPHPVMLGKTGVAWGRGVVAFDRPGPVKKEGDRRAPAGVFSLGTVFGYASATEAPPMKMPYLPLTAEVEGVDDPASKYYNRLVVRSRIAKPDWNSSEQMRSNDPRYRWGIFVKHNVPPVAGAGSCIFLHIWLKPGVPTVGCTAMDESVLRAIIGWLDAKAAPLLIQLPRGEYERARQDWKLPAIER